jgi:hypothetical protein
VPLPGRVGLDPGRQEETLLVEEPANKGPGPRPLDVLDREGVFFPEESSPVVLDFAEGHEVFAGGKRECIGIVHFS